MTIDMPSPMAQSMRTNRPSFSSSNVYDDTPVHNHAGVSNGDDYDSDSSNFAPSVFFHVRKIGDPIGLLPPGEIILGVNKRGVHFSRPVPNECLHSAEWRDIMQYGSNNTAIFFKMRVASVLHIFEFETKQGEEICVALKNHINDIMLRRDSKARSVAVGSVNGDIGNNLKESLNADKQSLEEVTCECDRLSLRSTCNEKDNAIQAATLEKRNMEVRLTKLNNLVLEESVEANNQDLHKLENELKVSRDELLVVEETITRLTNKKLVLERKLSELEKRNADENSVLAALKSRGNDLEKELKGFRQELAAAESALSVKDAELVALQNNLRELDELREMKEDIDRKNEQRAAILRMQGAQLAEMEALYKEEQVLWKRYFNKIEDMKGKIRVYCRRRPLSDKEINDKERDVLTSIDEFTIEHPWKDDRSKQFVYDRVFDDDATQEDVFEDTRYLVQSAVDGYNVCIFAYGQTGSGKTYTIYGTENNPGLIPRATAELFKILRRENNKYSFSLKAYMVELYEDTLIDLLLPKNAKRLKLDKNAKRLKLDIKKDSKGMVVVENVTVLPISTMEELNDIIERGSEQRHTSGTQINEESSRSHLILSVVIESTNLQTQSMARGKLSFVDLGGSERIKKSVFTRSQLKEAQSINKSLSALGDVISALSSGGQHIPYRNHKLTMLMSDSLGGNAKTLMFVNVSAAESNLEETHNSLMYASRVRLLVNDPTKNVSSKEVARLKKLVAHWKEQAGRRDDEEELEEIQEERPPKERDSVSESTCKIDNEKIKCFGYQQ
ncbi:hypothetical protein K1719_015120 [Acacia pycnantha]|nr:hypothetical protein K1719_015120 [Acacia pycnantha]